MQPGISAGVAAFQARMADRPFDTNALTTLLSQSQRFLAMDGMETPPAPEAPSAARSTRRYSYEPSMRSYSAPRTRSFRSSPNSLPKSDPGRYNF